MLLTLLSLVIVLGVLIFVHELGHFLVAKAVGIQVLRFSLGFGRPVIAWTRGETEYWISWIPLGGYVKMAGLEDEGMAGELEGGKSAVPIDPERSFEKKSLWARMAVILAGVTMNILLAFFIYSGLAAVSGVRVRSAIQVDTVLARALPPGTEALTGLARGDRILRINGDSVKSWTDLQTSLIKVDSTASLEIAGRAEPITVRLPADTAARVRLVTWGLLPLEPARIGMVFPGEPGARGGLKTGDVVIRAGGDSVRSWNDLVFKLWYSAGKEVPLTVVRDGRTVNLTVTPRAQTDEDKTSARPRPYGFIAAEGDFPESRERLPVLTSIKFGALQTAGQIGLVVGSVKRLVLGQASVKEVGGPIMIAQVSGQAVRLGLDRFLMFIAFFSVSLAVLNLLPIPVLDGGHAVFLIAEGIRRKPLSPQLRLRLTQIGMLIRAGASDREMVGALGVNIKLLYTLVFGIGAALAGLAGLMQAPILTAQIGMGENILIVAFVVIIIGGIGSVRGAFISSIFVGMTDTVGRAFLPDLLKLVLSPAGASTAGPALSSMLIYIVMAAILIVRPEGLFAAPGK